MTKLRLLILIICASFAVGCNSSNLSKSFASENSPTEAFIASPPGDIPIILEGLPLYRFWSPIYRSHFFTASNRERDKLIVSDPNWLYEGVAYNVKLKQFCSGYMPVYRFWSDRFKSHFYTIDQDEAIELAYFDHNWRYELIAFCASTTSGGGRIPVYRFYSAVYKSHFFTVSKSERDQLLFSDPNWSYEGIAYYAWPK